VNIGKRIKKNGVVNTGIIDAGNHDDSILTVAAVGFKNEFGIEVPERPFMRLTVKRTKKEIQKMRQKMMQKIINGELTLQKALGLLGEYMAGEIRETIINLRTPPNAPRTIEAKGFDNPLVETEQLKNSITYEAKT
jgi:hypothetical protein